MIEISGICVITVYTVIVAAVLKFSNGIEMDKSVRDQIYLIA